MTLPETWIGPAIIAAVIAAMVNMAGLFVPGRRQVETERRLRHRKRVDIQTALRAEIDHYVSALANPEMELDRIWREVVLSMEADENHAPVIPSEKNDTVFQSVLADISILPERVIRPVVTYYNQVAAISAIIDDMRAEGFRNSDRSHGPVMEQGQRIGMYTDYIGMKQIALSMGREASVALEESLKRETRRMNGALSNWGAGALSSRGVGPFGL
ncbi:MAG: hypothetical protein RIG84_16215 [Roseovarius sp.]